MLRNLIGDSAFFNILREWGRRYAYKTGTTQKFIQVVNDITGEDFSWFFNQWVYEAGYPVLDFSVSLVSYDTLFLHLQQVQKNSIIFKFPIEFKIQLQNLDTILTFWTYTADTVYKIALNYSGALSDIKVQIDPSEKVLKKVLSLPSKEINLSLPLRFVLHQNYPNPFNSSTKISFEVAGGFGIYLCEIKVFDVLGREVERIFRGELSSGRYSVNFTADGIPSGVYFYELTVSDRNRLVYRDFKKMVLIK